MGAGRQQVADGTVTEARSRHADSGGVTKPVDLPQPSAHLVPTGENLGPRIYSSLATPRDSETWEVKTCLPVLPRSWEAGSLSMLWSP
jgi:hypothetical protein